MTRSCRLLLTVPLIAFWCALVLPAYSQSSNYRACLSGHGYCDHSALTSAEAVEVESAEYQRNLSKCTSGYGYCDHAKLNPSDAAQAKLGESSRVQTVPSGGLNAGPGVAENGSYYGELNANGVPKTVHVNGYYRRDGTYVRGHYRSAPGTNPPRSH